MKANILYIVVLIIFFTDYPIIAQNDTSLYRRIMTWANYYSYTDTASSFFINTVGDTVKIDTVKRYYYYYHGEGDKTYYIYHNGKLEKEMKYYKNRLFIENIYIEEKNTKRIAYSGKRHNYLEKIFYFNYNGDRYKTEVYNKKGKLIKVIYENSN